ncbi:hypothetical protein [Cellvibrio fibrivorans]|uniref:Uncharacterized protein n=1 Tax=Cellvibrio fibrivorans TaxID=126350 RepID=A0ABU1V2Y0_9GAMM|nr:hypothetical protein [Cellvibrio fibrivorans]MDR7091760.1 hypothetical protein [Cellvibrio fibrivorans]
MQDTSPTPSTDLPTPTTKTPWYNRRLIVALWLIFFFPIGLLGLWMSERIHVIFKIAITIGLVIILNLDSQEEKDAKNAGFKSLSDKQAATELNLTTANSYYKYLDAQEQTRQGTIEAEKREAALQELEKEDLSVAAYIICQQHTKDNLASPASADFPFLPDEVLAFKGHSYIVHTYVDSQNKFGAMLRTKVLCKVKYKGTSAKDEERLDIKKWELRELAFTPS